MAIFFPPPQPAQQAPFVPIPAQGQQPPNIGPMPVVSEYVARAAWEPPFPIWQQPYEQSAKIVPLTLTYGQQPPNIGPMPVVSEYVVRAAWEPPFPVWQQPYEQSAKIVPLTLTYGQQPPPYSIVNQMVERQSWEPPFPVWQPPFQLPTQIVGLTFTYGSQPPPYSTVVMMTERQSWEPPFPVWQPPFQLPTQIVPLTLTYGQQPPPYSSVILFSIRQMWEPPFQYPQASSFGAAELYVAPATFIPYPYSVNNTTARFSWEPSAPQPPPLIGIAAWFVPPVVSAYLPPGNAGQLIRLVWSWQSRYVNVTTSTQTTGYVLTAPNIPINTTQVFATARQAWESPFPVGPFGPSGIAATYVPPVVNNPPPYSTVNLVTARYGWEPPFSPAFPPWQEPTEIVPITLSYGQPPPTTSLVNIFLVRQAWEPPFQLPQVVAPTVAEIYVPPVLNAPPPTSWVNLFVVRQAWEPAPPMPQQPLGYIAPQTLTYGTQVPVGVFNTQRIARMGWEPLFIYPQAPYPIASDVYIPPAANNPPPTSWVNQFLVRSLWEPPWIAPTPVETMAPLSNPFSPQAIVSVVFSADEKTVTVSYGSAYTYIMPRPVQSAWNYKTTGTTWWVAKTGNDANSGTQNQPFATIQHAINTAVAGDIIYVLPGVYSEALVIDQTKQGTPSQRFILSVAPKSAGGGLGTATIAVPGAQVVANPQVQTVQFTGASPANSARFWTLNGFLLQGARGLPGVDITNGGTGQCGVMIWNNAIEINITNCATFQNIHSGIKVYDVLDGMDSLFEGNVIFENGCDGFGHGLYVTNGPLTENGNIVFRNGGLQYAGYGLHNYGAQPNNLTITRNVCFYHLQAAGILVAGNNCLVQHNDCQNNDWGFLQAFGVAGQSNTYRDNIFAGNTQFDGLVQTGAVVTDHNLYQGTLSGFTADASDLTGVDPLWRNPSIGDFILRLTSPAIGNASDGTDRGAFVPVPVLAQVVALVPPVAPPPPFLIVDEDTLEAIRVLWQNAGNLIPVAIVDEDTLEAIRTLWNSSVLLPNLVALGSPQAGRLKSPQPLPYVQVSCELDRREIIGTAPGPWYDWRKVTFTIYALKVDVVQVAGAVLAVFNRDLGRPGFPTLNYPSGSRFMSWLPEGEVRLEQDDSTKDGRDIWKGVMVARVWSVRAK